MTRCDCCDLPIESCGKALEAAQAAERRALVERALQEPGVVLAKFPGNCPTCHERFPANTTPVKRTDDGWVNVLCCPETLDR